MGGIMKASASISRMSSDNKAFAAALHESAYAIIEAL